MDLLLCFVFTCIYCGIGIFCAWLMDAHEGDEIAFMIAFWPMVVFLCVVFVLCIYLPCRMFFWLKDMFRR